MPSTQSEQPSLGASTKSLGLSFRTVINQNSFERVRLSGKEGGKSTGRSGSLWHKTNAGHLSDAPWWPCTAQLSQMPLLQALDKIHLPGRFGYIQLVHREPKPGDLVLTSQHRFFP